MYTRSVVFWLSALTATSTLAADASAATSHPPASTLKQGYFIDSPVTGLYYKTSSNITGVTQQGAFHYQPGDVISFFLGNDGNHQTQSQHQYDASAAFSRQHA